MKGQGPMPTVVCRLSVGEAKVTDTGSWICELSNAAGKSTSTCNVKVVDTASDTSDTPPCFKELLSNITVTEFSDAVLKCKAVGKPEPDVRWFHNDVPVDPSFRYDMKSDSEGFQTLTVSNVKSADKGIYKIKVSNAAGWASCDAKLNIAHKVEDAVQPIERKVSEYTLDDNIKGRRSDQNMLNEADILLNAMCDSTALKKFIIKWKLDDKSLEFPVHLRNKCQVEGSQAVLKCLVNGIPPFKVRWYKGNNELFDGSKYFIRGNQNILSLEIPIVELEDTDHYMCVVRNDQGKIFTSGHLQIEPRLEKLSTEVPIKPFFTKPMKKQKVDEGELVIFRVAAKACPPPGFKWFKDGQELRENDRINIETLHNGGGQLTIHMATVRDIGLYVCEAHNHAGRARSMVRLSVRDKYEVAQEAAKKPIEDVTVSTKGEAEAVAQQNGDLAHTEEQYEPRVESGEYSKAPVFNAVLPKTIVIRDRGRFFMECSASGFPKPKVKWMKNDQVIQEDEHMHFLSVGHWFGLEILDALPRHEGVYTVTLENSSGCVTSSCRVEMKLPREEPQFFHTKEESLERVFHRPVLQLLQTEFPWHQFDIPGITPSFHLCNYEVDMTDNITKESICLVDTLETPQFTKPLPDMVTPYEQDIDLRLECEVGGKPCPKVVWLKDDTKLDDSDNISITWNPETRLTALIFRSVKLEDSGKYSCIAYSDVGGHALSSSVMQVRGLDYPDKEKEASKRTLPEFKVKLADKEAAPGEEVRLEVKAEGFPAPEVTWFKNSEPITETTEKFTITSSVEGIHALVIPDIHISDSDCFKCEAKNEYGVVTTCAHVKVSENSDFDNGDTIRPYFEEPLHSISVPLGQDAVFRCIAKGNPTPAFKWLRQGVTSIDQDRVKVEVTEGETSLTIKKVNIHDEGLYYCFANNNEGTVKSCASLTVVGKGATTAKLSEVNRAVEKEQKDHTLFEEKDFDDKPTKENKDAAVDKIEPLEKSKSEALVEAEADNPKPKEASTSEDNKSANIEEITLEAETVEEINTSTDDSIKKVDSDKLSEQTPESKEPVTVVGMTEESGKKTDAETPDEKKIEVDKQTEARANTGKLKEQRQSTEKSVTQNTEPVAKTETETKKLNDNTDKTDSEISKPIVKESDTNGEISAEKCSDSKAQTQNVVEAENVDNLETLKELGDIESEKIIKRKEITSETQIIESKFSEGNLMKSTDDSDSIKSQATEVPRFVSHPRSQWVTLNSPLELTFTAEKCEDLTVAWYRDGEILKDDRCQMIWE